MKNNSSWLGYLERHETGATVSRNNVGHSNSWLGIHNINNLRFYGIYFQLACLYLNKDAIVH